MKAKREVSPVRVPSNGDEGAERAAPRPSSLIEAMRSLGYTLETAIADLVDNSISHGASIIQIKFDWAGSDSSVSVSDDGCGMTEAQLIEAMRPGTHDPRASRAPSDLGRFGLGLKTASFSQASRLTVFSRAAGYPIATRIWDLPFVTECNDWMLLDEPSENALRHAAILESKESGTCVVWEKLDRLVGDAEADDEYAHRTYLEEAERVAAHLRMIFGDFLSGPKAVKILVGNVPLARWDPFLRDHPATQILPAETLRLRNGVIKVQPYVLPHHSKLSKDEFRDAGGINGWNAHQGFYIYRNRRLLVAGGWLSLGLTRDEHMKLARIRVDFGNDADFDWRLDIRKSIASPPVALREGLRRIARLTRERAQEVYRHRGRTIVSRSPSDPSSIWEARLMRGKTVFRINREHPVVQALVADGGTGRAVAALLTLIEQTVPLAAIYIRHAEAPDAQPIPFEDVKDRQCADMLTNLYRGLVGSGRSHTQAIAHLSALTLAGERPHLLAAIDDNPPKPDEID